MDTDDDMPLFLSGSNKRRVDYSDSEDDTLLSSTLDHDGFEGLNVSDKIKNIMSIDNFYMDNTFDDENNALFELPESVKNRETAGTSEATENKFMNFPFNKPESPPPAPQKKKRASAKKPKEKKRKRDRGKKKEAPKDIMERPANHERTTAFLKELAQEMDSSSDDEQSGRLYRPKPKKTRKGHKPKSLQQLDENGEQMIRTTDILDDTSSSEEDEKRMTKRDELEMYRETDRLRREANISIKPTFHKKSFNDLFSKLASRKSQTEHAASPPQDTLEKPMAEHEEFDDDLEIVGAPTNILSPEKSKASAIPWSPVATSNNIHKKHNQQLRDRIAQHMYARRKEMEEAAMSRGEYTSATDRAMKTLQREKENELIYLEVNKHFSNNKNSGNSDDDDDDDDDDEEDGDYDGGEDEQEGYDDDDIMAELSGQEEEDEEQEEKNEKDKTSSTHKDEESDENEEDDMATVAFKRWKRKPGKKYIFDDDEDEPDKPRIEPKKPEPKHSIAKFFQNSTKNTTSATKSIVSDENKPLSRLKQKEDEKEQVQEEEEDDAMDIDEEPSKPQQRVTFAPIPKKPLGPKPKSQFLEEEAEEEEDEHFGAGGPDADETEDLDQFEDDGLLVERNEETDNVDEAALKEKYSEQMMERDKNMIDRLMKDITSGGLRRRKAAAENGLMLDDFDIYDNDEDDLIAIRRAAAAKRRKMLLESGDVMERLASNPKTAAFAKAAQTVLDEESRVYLSDSEEEVEEIKYKSNSALVIEESDEEIEEEDDDEEEEEEKNRVGKASSSTPIIIKENRMEHVEEDEISFTELDIEIQTMARPNASPLAPHLKPFFLSPGKMDRFKSLLGDGRLSFGGSNDSGGARVGFGAPVPKKDKGKQPVRGFVPSKTDKKAAKSRLSGVMSSRADSFT